MLTWFFVRIKSANIGGNKVEKMLEMSTVTKTFPGVIALNKVDFCIKKGEIHALIGENGAGKSTLMKVLMGIYKCDEGCIKVCGDDVCISTPSDAIKLGIGMVPQELNLNPYISAAENIFLGNEIRNKFGAIDWKKTNLEAAKVLKTIGVNINPRTIVNKLSVAQQQLVQIARVLTTGADVLIFDEPTASLTNSEAEFLLKLMKKLKESGKSLVFISHHLEELLSTSDRITVLRDGCTVYVGDTKDVTKDFLIEKMAGKKIEKLKREERKIDDVEYFRVENLSRKGEFSDVSFNVKKGEIFGIGGLVGSGRTELANAIFGLTKKSSGKIYLEEKEIEINSPSKAISLGIGYVPEERRSYGIFPILSVMENMVVSIYDILFKGAKIQNKKARQVTEEHIKKMRIRTPSAKTPIQSLSGGNQQKVILSRWMAKDVDLLILDEPTRGIDVNAKGEIYELIRKMTEQGMTVIIISSEHEELLLLSDRLMIMHEGKVKGIRENANLEQQDILEMAFK